MITGASRGIGAATARLLASQNYNVCLNYHRQTQCAEELSTELRQQGCNTLLLQADVSQEAQVKEMFQTIDDTFGPLTHLVNNAGILKPQMRLQDMTADRINEILTTNVTGYFLCCREAIMRMSVNHGGQGGAIVNVSSVAARTGSPGEYIDYAASKGAIDTLTTGLATELAAEDIRVNGVRPGFIYTDMHRDGGEPERIERLKPAIPMQRGGQPEEVAEAIAWLLSDKASYTTGSFIDLAGGK
ncbi:SDR family oxidoreductase [Aliamphritea spongicola]|nr:SDR family oxidoreductase [Aliamphritea spongicola]